MVGWAVCILYTHRQQALLAFASFLAAYWLKGFMIIRYKLTNKFIRLPIFRLTSKWIERKSALSAFARTCWDISISSENCFQSRMVTVQNAA